MTGREFINTVRLLWNIDKHELVEAGFPASAWDAFAKDPLHFIIRCDDETFDKIWSVIKARTRPNQEG